VALTDAGGEHAVDTYGLVTDAPGMRLSPLGQGGVERRGKSHGGEAYPLRDTQGSTEATAAPF
jgi:hypothetical protein